MKQEKACGAIISRVNQEGITEILLVRQRNGFTSFPKGHVEPGETEVKTAKREVKEETGLDIEIPESSPRLELSYDMAIGSMYRNPPIPSEPIHKTVVLFLGQIQSGSESAQESEIAELIWAPIDEVESHLAYPAWRRVWHEAQPLLNP